MRSGKFYKPDGTLGSEVSNGTGTQTLWYPDGTIRWELVLRNYTRFQHSWWFDNGQLIQTQHYVDGEVDGKFEAFHRNGKVRVQGEYANGERMGVWNSFRREWESRIHRGLFCFPADNQKAIELSKPLNGFCPSSRTRLSLHALAKEAGVEPQGMITLVGAISKVDYKRDR